MAIYFTFSSPNSIVLFFIYFKINADIYLVIYFALLHITLIISCFLLQRSKDLFTKIELAIRVQEEQVRTIQTIWTCLLGGDSGEELLSQHGLSLGKLSLPMDPMETGSEVGGPGTSAGGSTPSGMAHMLTPRTNLFREFKESLPDNSDSFDGEGDKPVEGDCGKWCQCLRVVL